jgi:hypothetical protein
MPWTHALSIAYKTGYHLTLMSTTLLNGHVWQNFHNFPLAKVTFPLIYHSLEDKETMLATLHCK